MRVKVKFISDKAKALYLKASDGESIFPFKKYESDFCYDVVATSCEEIAPNVYKYGLGVAFQIDRGADLLLHPQSYPSTSDLVHQFGRLVWYYPTAQAQSMNRTQARCLLSSTISSHICRYTKSVTA